LKGEIEMSDTAQMQRARYCAKKFGLTVRKIDGGYIISDRKKIITRILTFGEMQKYLIDLRIDELKNLSVVSN
jgi:hypothetical protein